jgi:hypothetical protein
VGTLSKPYKDEFNYVLVVAVAMATATTYSTKTVDNIYKMLIRSHPVGQPATAGPLFILFYFILFYFILFPNLWMIKVRPF